MCVSEEEPSPSTAGSTGGSIEEVIVTADRLGIDMDMFNLIDWDEVAKNAFFGTIGGALGSGNIWGAIGAGLAAGASAAESQEDVDLEDLFVINNDMIIISGAPSPYLMAY